jgi:hypothetical protein
MNKSWKFYLRYKPYNAEDDPYQSKKAKKQSRKFFKKYGFRKEESWGLNTAIAIYLLPRLAYLKEHVHSYPPGLDVFNEFGEKISSGYDEWIKILEKMIDGFEIIANDQIYPPMSKEDEVKANEALDLFRKFFWDLWD